MTESDEERARERQALRTSLSDYAAGGATDRIAAAARFLAATPSHLVMISIEDLLGVADQVNIPGTLAQHPNWRRKLPLTLEDWESQPVFAEIAAVFRSAGRAI
jgi:4-alpha-glucanotransferase